MRDEKKIDMKILLKNRILDLRVDFRESDIERVRESIKRLEILNLNTYRKTFGVDFDMDYRA